MKALSLLAPICLLVATGTVSAHAVIVTSNPGVDEVMHGNTIPIELRFNSRIDRERSRLSLIEPDGSVAPLTLADQGPDTLAATASGLSPGAYRLHWQVLGIDGHITRGEIPFRVEP